MNESRRVLKRIIIIGIYFLIFLAITLVVYFLVRSHETCGDNVQNQNETGVDCGGVCQPCKELQANDIVVKEQGYLNAGQNGSYDAYVKMTNPNPQLGSKRFEYEFRLLDQNGSPIAVRDGTGFILPNEEKYIVENNITGTGEPSQMDFRIKNVDWVEFNSYYEKPQLKIINRTYNEIQSGSGFAEANGLLKNESPYDFNQIKVGVLLRDENGNVVALNSTEMKTVKSGEEREFKVSWPNSFAGNVSSIEMQPEVNILDFESFFKRSFPTQKFQEY
jgi:hypothetical protein